jgi:hypothetical protein
MRQSYIRYKIKVILYKLNGDRSFNLYNRLHKKSLTFPTNCVTRAARHVYIQGQKLLHFPVTFATANRRIGVIV